MSRSVADWLSLAAAPLFGGMAFLTLALGDRHAAMLCTQAGLPPMLAGMGPMYLLMAAVHLPPWLRPTPSDHIGPGTS